MDLLEVSYKRDKDGIKRTGTYLTVLTRLLARPSPDLTSAETNIVYRLITCRVRYFKPLFVIILNIMEYRYEYLFTIF